MWFDHGSVHYPPPAALVAPLERQRSPQAQAGRGAAIFVHVDWPGGGGTAAHQPLSQGFTEGPPWDPIEPVHERFTKL